MVRDHWKAPALIGVVSSTRRLISAFRVRPATSWHSGSPAEHAAVTRRPSHARTRANIAEAVWRSIPLRVGIVGVQDGRRTRQAEAMPAELGVTDIG